MIEGFGSFYNNDIDELPPAADGWNWTYLAPSLNNTYGRRSTGGLRLNTNNNSTVTWQPDTAFDSFVFGFAIKPRVQATQYWFFGLYDDPVSQNQQGYLIINTDGSISVVTAGVGTIATSAAGVFTDEIWSYLEFKGTCTGNDNIAVKVDGVEVINVSGANFRGSGCSTSDIGMIKFHTTSSSNYTYICDLYVLDQAGLTFTDFLGDVKVDAFMPTSDGNYTDFTPSTGIDHYAVVDDISTASSAYIESDTVTEKDSFGFTITGDLPTIYAVSVENCSQNSDTGIAEGTVLVRMGGVDYDQDTFDRGASVERDKQILLRRPDTGGIWTKTILNATEFGVEFSNAS